MTTRRLFSYLFLSLAVGASPQLSTAGEPGDARARREAATDYAGFIERLRARGASVEIEGEAEQPFLSVTGKMIKIDGEDVQVFQFSSPAAVETQAARISRDGGTVGTNKIQWIDSPHFYKQGKLLVLYVGDDDKALKALESVLGPQFAGK